MLLAECYSISMDTDCAFLWFQTYSALVELMSTSSVLTEAELLLDQWDFYPNNENITASS